MKQHHLIKWILFPLISFVIAFGLVYFIKGQGLFNQSVASTDQAEELVSEFQARENYLNRESSFVYDSISQDNVIFIGDSLIQRSEWAELLSNPKIMNFGINGDTIAGVYRRMNEILERHPQAIFMLVGVNDLYLNQFSESELVNQYRQTVQRIRQQSPDSQFYALSLLPVNQSKFAHPVDNQKVVSFNGQIQPLVESLGGTFINVHPKLLNQAGELDAKYTYDGIHLNADGYTVLAQTILDQIQ